MSAASSGKGLANEIEANADHAGAIEFAQLVCGDGGIDDGDAAQATADCLGQPDRV